MEAKRRQVRPRPAIDRYLQRVADTGCLLVAHGAGWNSTAMLIRMVQRNIRPRAILFADVGNERIGTYRFIPVFREWLLNHGMPAETIVRYRTVRAPYRTIAGNCIANATLPSAAMNIGACTIKWKICPQMRWTRSYPPAKDVWARGEKVVKLIGFDAGEEYRQSRAADKAHQGKGTKGESLYENLYPLLDWGISRQGCADIIQNAGLELPPKSSCVICPNQKPRELRDLTPRERSIIILVELMTEPYNTKVHGIWRLPRKRDGRPGSVTEYILQHGLEFESLTKVCGQVALNPNCGKFKTGYTLKPPHRDVLLKELLVKAGHSVPEISMLPAEMLDRPFEDIHPARLYGCAEYLDLEDALHGCLIDAL